MSVNESEPRPEAGSRRGAESGGAAGPPGPGREAELSGAAGAGATTGRSVSPGSGSSAASGAPVAFTAGDVEMTVLPGDGCRIGSLRIGGTELLRTEGPSLHRYGAFPMVPWVGRVRGGVFRNGTRVHHLPLNSPPHAIHGTATDHPWYRTGDTSFGVRLASPWPYEGFVSQEFRLTEEELRVTLMVESAEESFPAQLGWHPWFVRQLAGPGGAPLGAPVRLDFDPSWMWERADDHVPDGRRVEPGPGPWDDCFGMPDGVRATLTWPGALRLEVSSSGCDAVVVYDEPEDALCVEPQTGPPNGLNSDPIRVTPMEPLEATMVWRWTRLAELAP